MGEFTPSPVLALLLAGLLPLLFTRHRTPVVAGVPDTTTARHRTCRTCRRPLEDPATLAVAEDALLDRWRAHLRERCADASVTLWVGTITDWLAYLKSRRRRWHKATGADLDRWLARNKRVSAPGGGLKETDEQISPATQRGNEDAVCLLYAWATAEGLLARDPFARRVRTVPPEPGERYIPREDMRRLFAAAEALGDGLRMLVMIRLIFDAGFRRGEVARARIEHMRLTDRLVGVRSKGRRGAVAHWVPMSEDLHAVLARYLSGKPKSGPLLPSRGPSNRGGHMGPGYVGRLIREFLLECGVDETSHGIRHTAGKEIYEVEGNLYAAQVFLRHASPETTGRTYLKGAKEAVWRAVAGRPPVSEDFEVMGGPRRRVGETDRFPGLGDRAAGGPHVLGSGGHEVARRTDRTPPEHSLREE